MNQVWQRDYFDWWDIDLPSNPHGTIACTPSAPFPGTTANQRVFSGLVPGATYVFTVWGSLPGGYPDSSPYDYWVAVSSWQGGASDNYLWKHGGARGPNYPDGSAAFSNSVMVVPNSDGNVNLRYLCGAILNGLSYFRIR